MMTKRTLGFLVSVVMLVLAVPAGAHQQDVSDPDDIGDRMDIRAVSVSHTARRLRVDIRTWQGWGSSNLGRRTFYFNFDTKGDGEPDYGFNILRRNGRLKCLLQHEPEGHRIGKGTVFRKSRRHVGCRFPRSAFELGADTTVRWQGSMYNLETFESDRIPDSGRVRHRL